ncbi:MAG: FkbM family methyltransferase [Oceanicaulis sp.]
MAGKSNVGEALQRMRKRKLGIRSFINLGSGAGDDIGFYRSVWPDMSALMVEMDTRFVPGFEKLAKKHKDFHWATCAVGPRDGVGYFDKSNDVGGVLRITDSEDSVPEGSNPVRVAKLDTLVDEYGLQGPHFIKFDTHGVEREILSGAEKTLRNTGMIIMEAYNFRLNFTGGNNLTFDEMVGFMRERGFRLIDLIDPLYRPKDHALWQVHLAFIRDDHPLWKSNSYSGGDPEFG